MKPELKIVASNTLSDVAKFNLVYLASPYSKYPARDGMTGLEVAFRDISKIAAKLLRLGLRVYSPIAHTHPIAVYGNVDALDHSIWLPFDQAIMEKSDAMLVAKMETWQISTGIKHEIDFFTEAGKPIFYLDIETLEVRQ